MKRLIKRLRYIPDRTSDVMRHLCGRLSSDARFVLVVAMLAGFSALSVYMTVSSIYRIGKKEGRRLEIEHLRRIQLEKDSVIHPFKRKHYGNDGANR